MLFSLFLLIVALWLPFLLLHRKKRRVKQEEGTDAEKLLVDMLILRLGALPYTNKAKNSINFKNTAVYYYSGSIVVSHRGSRIDMSSTQAERLREAYFRYRDGCKAMGEANATAARDMLAVDAIEDLL